MVASNIRVFIRVRPSARASKGFVADLEKGGLSFEVDKTTPDREVNNTRTSHKFHFDGILPMVATQQEVFETVAKPVIDDVLQGINGTIFAYGQTGSGKTFTITGGAERYEDRGLIPRTIAYLFENFKANSNCKFSLYISYLEIYNNDGYDLLSREDTATKLEDLPKVVLREDEEGNIKLRNLSVNMAQREEDALNLLFLGDTNRVVAETPMNDASTRSHCMFIIWVESTKPDSDTVRRAKLHLVDLAGSERIGKTGVEGKLKQEATAINLSLHYLESVIVALHERSQGRRSHVPYRNSILTSVLRDSLGGNCRTLMVGTIATEESNVDESISTCRFAQRVACIKNNATINEELDPALMIRRLKKDVAHLKDELKMISAGDEEGELTEEDLGECRKLVTSYLEEVDPAAPFVCGSVRRFRECFQILRQVYWQREGDSSCAGPGEAAAPMCGASDAGPPAPGSLQATVLELREQMARRDQEIALLLSSLNKRSGKGRDVSAKDVPVFIRGSRHQGSGAAQDVGAVEARSEAPASAGPVAAASAAPPASFGSTAGLSHAESAALLLDRNKAFEVFRKSVRRSETLEENKEVIKKLKEEAQALGKAANAAREVISGNTTRVQKLRMERALDSNPRDPTSQEAPPDAPDVLALLKENEEKKRTYHQAMQRLQQVKGEIESYKKAMEENTSRLQRDFEAWYRSLEAASGGGLPAGPTDEEEPAAASPSTTAASASRPSWRATSTASSVRSEADSSARATPVQGARRPAAAPAAPPPAASPARRVELDDRPLPAVGAWGGVADAPPRPPRGPASASPSAAASASKLAVASASPATAASTSPVAASPTSACPGPQAATPSAVKLTGDEQTDKDIAAYFEALAALSR